MEGKTLYMIQLVLPMGFCTKIDIERSELLECLKYLPEMDDFYDSVEYILNLPSPHDDSLSCVWLKDAQYLWGSCINLRTSVRQIIQDFTKECCRWRVILLLTLNMVMTRKLIGRYVYQILISSCSKVFPHTAESPIAVGKQRLLQGVYRYFQADLRKIIDNFYCDTCLSKIQSRWHTFWPSTS